MHKHINILLIIMVAVTYVGATMLSGAHHHHGGAICLRAALMHSCHDTQETDASGTHGYGNHHHGEEHPGCTYSVEILTASPQRQEAQATCQAIPQAVITQTAVQQKPVVQNYKFRVFRNSAPYTPPVVQDSELLRAPPYSA